MNGAWIRSRRGAITVALVGTLVLVGGLEALRRSAPAATLERVGQGAEPPGTLELEALACERRVTGRTEQALEAPPRGARVSSSRLIECPVLFNGRFVTYVGEVVGDVLDRPGGAWVLVNDDAYGVEQGPLPVSGVPRGANTGLAVWLPDPMPTRLSGPGGPRRRGDVIEVTGHVHRTDIHDGGGLTIRADGLRILLPSAAVDPPVHVAQAVTAGVVAVLAGLAVLADLRRRRER